MVADEELDTWNDDAAAAVVAASHPSYSFYDGTVTVYFDQVPHIYYRKNERGEREEIDGVTTVLQSINKPYLKPWIAKVTVNKMKELLFHPDGTLRSLSTEEVLSALEIAKREHKEVLNKAGGIGTLAHNAIEKSVIHAIEHTGGVVKERPIVVPDPYIPATAADLEQAQNCADAAYDWMVAHNVRWLHTERKIYSREYNFSGTLDGDALIDSCTDRFCKGCRGRVFKDRRAVTDWKTSNQLSDEYALQTAAYVLAHLEEFEGLFIQDRWILRLGKEDGAFECWYLPAETFEDDLEAFLDTLRQYRSMKAIKSRRGAESKEFTAFVRTTKKTEKEAVEELDKVQRAEEREKLKAAKALWDEDRKLLYKQLRLEKIPKAEAEAEVERRLPKSQRPGAKDGIIVEVKVDVEPILKAVADAKREIAKVQESISTVNVVTNSGRKVLSLDDTPAVTAPTTTVSQSGRRILQF